MFQTDGETAFQEAIDYAERSGIAVTGFQPGDETDIAALENRLGVQLPPSYKAMIRLYGTVNFDALEVYGLTKLTGLDGKGIPNVVFATEDARHRGIIGNGMILFMTSGFGPAFLLDCNEADGSGEAPVYEFPVGGVAYGRDKLASSFGRFILDEVQSLSAS